MLASECWATARAIKPKCATPSAGDELSSRKASKPAEDPAEALRRCGINKSLHDGRLLHSILLIRYGTHPPTFLSNCLIQMYGLCGSTPDAQKTFDTLHCASHVSWTILLRAYGLNGDLVQAKSAFNSMPCPDVISWNTMITTYAQNGHCRDAINVFVDMHRSGPQPNKVTFVCALDACYNLQTVRDIHDEILRLQFETNVTVGNALITMYGKYGDVHDAEQCFAAMETRDVVTWSAMIALYVHNGIERDALQLFQVMMLEDVKPNNITCVSILDACGTLGELRGGQIAHAIVLEYGYEKSVPVGNALVNMFGKCGSLPDAGTAFISMHGRNVVTWSSLMGAYAQKGCHVEMLQLFHEMLHDGVKPDQVTFICLLEASANIISLECGREIHAAILESGFELELKIGNVLINFYGKHGNLEDARCVFINMLSKDVVSWSTIIVVFAQSGHGKEALDFFQQMQATSIKPNEVTLVCVLEACHNAIEGQLVHGAMVCTGYEGHNAVVQTALINMYDEFGSYADARSIFERIMEHDSVSWTSGIAACAHNEHSRDALELFYEMQGKKGVQSNSVTFVCVLDACCSVVALEEGMEVHAAILNDGCDDDGVLLNALINMYGKCGDAHDAISLFHVTPNRDLVAWNAVLSACALNGCGDEALGLVNQMRMEEVSPNGVTFVCILTSCSHGGHIEEGFHNFFVLCKWHHVLLTEEHFACMTDLSGRAGQLEIAERMVRWAPYQRATSALTSLIGACKSHGDAERGLTHAKGMLDMNPGDAVVYVDLSNIYARATPCE